VLHQDAIFRFIGPVDIHVFAAMPGHDMVIAIPGRHKLEHLILASGKPCPCYNIGTILLGFGSYIHIEIIGWQLDPTKARRSVEPEFLFCRFSIKFS
jgi:hypothetical protein